MIAALAVTTPQGPAAAEIEWLWWLLFWLGLAVYVLVMGLLLVPVIRRWRNRPDDLTGSGVEDRHRAGSLMIWGGGVVMPAIILLVLVVASAIVGERVPWNTNPSEDVDVSIDVAGHMFWWEVEYPDLDVTTANEIVIPAGEPVQLRLTSPDVIHSFWVPELHGKIDLTPGHGTSITLEADEPGEYRGQCAEYCGLAHAQMRILVRAVERDEFDEWATAQAEPAPQLETAEARAGREVFMSSSCVYCHTVEGHGPDSDVGPDLTHFASRETIAAGAAPNTRGHLGGWIVDPQQIKPGNRMPGTQIAGEDLQLLLDYLESLE